MSLIVLNDTATVADIEDALAEVNSDGGGSVILEDGLYVINTAIGWPNACDNVTLEGSSHNTVLDTRVYGDGYTMRIVNSSAVVNVPANNVAINATSFTCNTAATGAQFLENTPIVIFGTDSNGARRAEANEVAANGSGSTGVVNLKSPISRGMHTIVINGYVHGHNNAIRNFKIIHSEGAAHGPEADYQFNLKIENVQLDGSIGSTNYGLEIRNGLNNTIRDVLLSNYNIPQSIADHAYGMHLSNHVGLKCLENTIRNCSNSSKANRSSLELRGIYKSLIAGNLIENSKGEGVRLYNFSFQNDSVIAHNRCLNGNDSGIKIVDTNYNYDLTLIGNICDDNNGTGMHINVKRASIIGNQCNSNTNGYGIAMESGSSQVSLNGNGCHGNFAGLGLFSGGSSFAVTGNDLSQNQYYGIELSGVNKVSMVGNIIQNNASQNVKYVGTNTNIESVGNIE